MRRSRTGQLRDIAVGLAMAGLVVVLTPVSLIHDMWSRKRRSGGTVEIKRIPASSESLQRLLRENRPVIIEGLAAHIGAPAVDLAGLREFARSQPAPVNVDFVEPEHPYFLYTGDYGRTVAHREQLSLAEMLDVLFIEGTDDEVVYKLFGPGGVHGAIGEVIDQVAAAIRSAGGGEIVRDASGIWIGSPGVVTPLHHDAWRGLLFQTEGRKSVTMFEPADRGKLYFNFPIPVGSRWSRLPARSAEADSSSFPHFSQARRHTAVLEPGDVLFIPTFWAHEMEGLTANISIPLRLQSPKSTYLDPGFLRPATEVLDGKLRRLRPDRAA